LIGLRNNADSQDNPEVINWPALGTKTQNSLRQRIDNIKDFSRRFDADPRLTSICSFDAQGVHLKTNAETAGPQSGGNTGKTTVSQMAKKATAKRIG
jgi:hypothetical protein